MIVGETTILEETVRGTEDWTPIERFVLLVSGHIPGFQIPVDPRELELGMEDCKPLPPPPCPNSAEGSGVDAGDRVTFTESLSWVHGAGHEVQAGDSGEVAWKWQSGGQDRLAVKWRGVLLHSVPAECVRRL